MGVRIFPPEVLAFFEANNYGKTAQEMTDLLNQKFGTNYTIDQVKNCRQRNHWRSGVRPEHLFKPGYTPHGHRPVGSERTNRDGYRERKVAEPNKWALVHVLNWEAVNGPIPQGHLLLFKDGDKSNCEVSNLLLATRGELGAMNLHGLYAPNPETLEARLALTRYRRAVEARKKRR